MSLGSQPKITTVTWVRTGGSMEAKQKSLNTHREIRKPRHTTHVLYTISNRDKAASPDCKLFIF